MSLFGQDLDRLYTLMKRAAAVGALLAVLCHLLPPHYRYPCNAVARICRGG